MQRDEHGVLLSTSDPMRYAGCAHATRRDLVRLEGRDPLRARKPLTPRSARAAVMQMRRAISYGAGRRAGRSSRFGAAPERRAKVVLRSARSGGRGGWSDFLGGCTGGRRLGGGAAR
jgi:hypothetical protein